MRAALNIKLSNLSKMFIFKSSHFRRRVALANKNLFEVDTELYISNEKIINYFWWQSGKRLASSAHVNIVQFFIITGG